MSKSQAWTYEVTSLFNCAITAFIKFLSKREDWEIVKILPMHIKDILFSLLSKRGKISDDNIKLILHNRIEVINLSDCNITDQGLLQITICKKLEKLDINSVDTRDCVSSVALIKVFESCQSLKNVGLRKCIGATDDAVLKLAVCCPNLDCLNISYCSNLTNKSLEALGMFAHNLKYIDFSNTLVEDEGVKSLVTGNCRDKLKEICMKNCSLLTENAIRYITLNCPKLDIFVFDNYPVVCDATRETLELINQQKFSKKQISWTFH